MNGQSVLFQAGPEAEKHLAGNEQFPCCPPELAIKIRVALGIGFDSNERASATRVSAPHFSGLRLLCRMKA